MSNAKAKRNLNARTLYAPKYVWDRFDAIKAYYVDMYGFDSLNNSDILRCMAKRIEINTDKETENIELKSKTNF